MISDFSYVEIVWLAFFHKPKILICYMKNLTQDYVMLTEKKKKLCMQNFFWKLCNWVQNSICVWKNTKTTFGKISELLEKVLLSQSQKC